MASFGVDDDTVLFKSQNDSSIGASSEMTDNVAVCGQEPAGNFVGFMALRWTARSVAVSGQSVDVF